jgi:Tfp pilus assembly protein PilN
MALRDVNLVPEHVLHGRYVIRCITAWVLAYLLLIGSCVGAYVVYTQRTLARRSPPISEAQLRKQLAATIVEVQKKMSEVERLAFVRRVSRPRGATLVLDRLAAVMDPQIWLTDLSLLTHEGSGTTLVLSGLSVSHAKLGALIGQLTNDRMFGNVVLKRAAEARGSADANDRSSDLIAFTIQADIHGE